MTNEKLKNQILKEISLVKLSLSMFWTYSKTFVSNWTMKDICTTSILFISPRMIYSDRIISGIGTAQTKAKLIK